MRLGLSTTSVIISSDFTSGRSQCHLYPPSYPALPIFEWLRGATADRSCHLSLPLSSFDSFEVLCDFTLLALTLSPLSLSLSMALLFFVSLSLSLVLLLPLLFLPLSLSLPPSPLSALNSFDVVLHMLAKSFCIADVPQPQLLSLLALQLVS